MPKVRLGTFNCENLFARFRFNRNVNLDRTTKNGFTVNDLYFDLLNQTEKKLTAKVIQAINADVLVLQEVENLDVLKRFRCKQLSKLRYTYALLIDGNDPRQIDVAVLSRFPIVTARSHQELKSGKRYIFSRDCLEVEISVRGKLLTLFINHFKSMLDRRDPKNGRKNTRARRALQARTVKKLVKNRFGKNPGRHPWAILGDFNDYRGSGQGTTSAVRGLTNWSEVENVVDRLPLAERWTHFYDGAESPDDSYRQLDYILLSKSLSRSTRGKPNIERRGITTKATRVRERFKGVTARSEASDHCALAIDVVL